MNSAIVIATLITVYLISYFPASYVVLKLTGVRERIYKRSFSFGSIIAILQLVPPLLFGILFGNPGGMFGSFLALIFSYKYIAKVLNIRNVTNAAIVVFLPMVSTIIAAVAYLVIFDFMSQGTKA